jgi:hypothetical protein
MFLFFFSWEMVLSAIERWISEKKWVYLEVATALLFEMIAMLRLTILSFKPQLY